MNSYNSNTENKENIYNFVFHKFTSNIHIHNNLERVITSLLRDSQRDFNHKLISI